ncbi:Uncharacterised protein [Rhodococcus rhodochrous]|nr:Uncharacterised protein [Rhodococcus rhodochrous]
MIDGAGGFRVRVPTADEAEAIAGDPIGDDAPVRALRLHTLYVLPGHRGCGAGQALVEVRLVRRPCRAPRSR